MKHLLLGVLTCLSCPTAFGQADVEVRVRGLDGAPVYRTNAIVCDAMTGLPVLENGIPFTREDPERGSREILFLQTDENGIARFENLPAGSYRIVAQAWEGTPGPLALLDTNGIQVHLHGVSGVFEVPEAPDGSDGTDGPDGRDGAHNADGEAGHPGTPGDPAPAADPIAIDLAPLGTGVLEIDLKMPNDETLAVVSLSPMGADPVLGFAGWNGDFMRGMLCGNRMPAGLTRFTGLPEGEVHIGIFAGDNVPGFGAATVGIEPDRVAMVEIPLVVMWASGVHAPPPELEALTEKLAGLDREQLDRIAARFRAGPEAARSPIHAMAGLASQLDETYAFDDGQVATLGEVYAALAYTLMDRTIQSQGYRPNAYRPPVIRYEDEPGP